MSKRRIAALAAVALCLGLAVVLALLASDLRSWQVQLRSGDLAFAAAPGAEASWQADEILPLGAARHLLAVDDDLAFRRAVALFRSANAIGVEAFRRTDARVRAEAALARVVRSDGDRRRASVAANLLGVLALIDATSGAAGSATPLERSVFELQDAIRLDPGDDQAKANLELVYELTRGQSTLRGGGARPGGPRSGATASNAGHGY